MLDEYLEKMRYIAKRETRSLSNLLEHLCKLYIEKYEQDNGEIKSCLEVIADAKYQDEYLEKCGVLPGAKRKVK